MIRGMSIIRPVSVAEGLEAHRAQLRPVNKKALKDLEVEEAEQQRRQWSRDERRLNTILRFP